MSDFINIEKVKDVIIYYYVVGLRETDQPVTSWSLLFARKAFGPEAFQKRSFTPRSSNSKSQQEVTDWKSPE